MGPLEDFHSAALPNIESSREAFLTQGLAPGLATSAQMHF